LYHLCSFSCETSSVIVILKYSSLIGIYPTDCRIIPF